MIRTVTFGRNQKPAEEQIKQTATYSKAGYLISYTRNIFLPNKKSPAFAELFQCF